MESAEQPENQTIITIGIRRIITADSFYPIQKLSLETSHQGAGQVVAGTYMVPG